MAKKWKKIFWGTLASIVISSAVVCAAVSCGSNSNSSNNQSTSSSNSSNQTMSNSLIVASIANQLTNNTGSLSAKGISSNSIPTTYITDSNKAFSTAWGNYFASKAPNGYVASLTGYQSVTVPTDQVTFNVIETNYRTDSVRLELNYKNAGATITINDVPQTNLPAQMVVNKLANALAGSSLTIDATNISALSSLDITNSQQSLNNAITSYLQSQITSTGFTFSDYGYNSVTINSSNVQTSTNPSGDLSFSVGTPDFSNDSIPVTITYNQVSANITIANISQTNTPSSYILNQVINNITDNSGMLNVANISSLQNAYLTDLESSLSTTYNNYFQSLFGSKDFQETGYNQVSVNSSAITYEVSGVDLSDDSLTITATYNGANASFKVINVPKTNQPQTTIVGDIINTITNNAGMLQAMNIPELADYNLGSPTISINNAITKYLNSQFGTNGVTYSGTGFIPTTVNSTNVAYTYTYNYSTNSITVNVTYGSASSSFDIENMPTASFSNSTIAQFIVSQLLNGANSLNATSVSYLTNINLATPNITNAINQAIASQFTTTGWVLQKQGYTSITINKDSLSSGMVKISVSPVSDQSATVTITYNGSAAAMLQVTNIPDANFTSQMIANDLAQKLTNSTNATVAFSSISDWKSFNILSANSFLTYFTNQFTTTGWTFSQTGYNSVTINKQSLTSGQVSLVVQTPDYAKNSIIIMVEYNGASAPITITGVPNANFTNQTIANDIKNKLTNNNPNGLDLQTTSYLESYNLQTTDLTNKLTSAIEDQFTSTGWTFSQDGYNPITISSANLTSSQNKVSVSVSNPIGATCTVTITYMDSEATFEITNIPNSPTTIVNYLKTNFIDKLTNNTLDISNLTFPSESDAKAFTVAQVINSKHQKYYTTLIFEQYLASQNIKTITINGVQYTVQSIANDLSSMIPSTVSETNFDDGMIPNVTVQYNGTSLGVITITGFAKPQTKDFNMQDNAIANVLKNYLSKLPNQTLNIANWKFPSNANATSFNALQVLHSNQLNYYTGVVFKTYFANNNITTITANGVIYPVDQLANSLSTILPTAITNADFEAGTVAGIKVQYSNIDVGMINITGFAKPTTSDINTQNMDLTAKIKATVASLNGTLDISNLTFPSDSDAKSFTVIQVLASKHQDYYTSLIFTQYFASMKETSITVNGVIYEINDLANEIRATLPTSVTESDYESGTIPSVALNFDGNSVGTISITGFAKPTTSDVNAQNMAIAAKIKADVASLNGTLDISNLTFPSDSNAKSFTVTQVLASKHQDYYTSLIFKQYFANMKETTIIVNGVIYQISDLANEIRATLPTSVTESDYESGTIPSVALNFDGNSVGTISITGFAKPTTSDINAQNMAIAAKIKADVSSLNGTLDISNLTFPSDSNAKSFTVTQVLASKHQDYYTSLIFKQYFASMKETTIIVNGVIYQISDLANEIRATLPTSVTESDYESGTIPSVA